jgi:hypothetical protein
VPFCCRHPPPSPFASVAQQSVRLRKILVVHDQPTLDRPGATLQHTGMPIEQKSVDSRVGQQSGQKREPNRIVGRDHNAHEGMVSRMVLPRNRSGL